MRYSLAATTMLALFLQACTRWTPVAVEPAAFPPASPVRATLRTGQRVTVKSPVILDDTLREASTSGVQWSRPVPKSGIPLAEINRLEVQKFDAGATAGLVVGTGVAVAAITLLMLAKAFDTDWGCFYCFPT